MTKNEIFVLPPEEADFCVLDVETTGLSPRVNGIIEIGIVKVSNLKIVDKYHSLINPGKDIPYFITQLTGITNEEVYDAPFFEDISAEVEDFISGSVLTAHNFSFDNSFLRREFRYIGKEYPQNPGLCTMKLARRLYPLLKSKSLKSVCAHLKLKNKDAHRALSDAEITARALIKMVKEAKQKHKVETVGDLLHLQQAPKSSLREEIKKKALSEDMMSLPDAPGIYYFLNSKGEVIYIGKAKSLRNRLRSYFSSAAPGKSKKIVKQASRLKIEITNSELTALLSEAESIKLINPKHNYQLKRYGNKYFLRINTTHKFPTLEICNFFDFDGNDYFGLFISRKKAAAVHEMLTRTFALRECSDEEFDKGKKCFLAEIERCSAPCAGEGIIEYKDELEKVYDFLYGRRQFALNRLINKMKDYSDKEKYEKAAEVKELIDMLLSQTHKSSLLAEPVNKANVLFEVSEGFGKDYILMLEGKIFIKKYILKEKDMFEESLEDYFEGALNLSALPNDEDLEKMKITLNWLVRNRNKVRAFYLKDYKNKQELYAKLSSGNTRQAVPLESTFDLKNFISHLEPDETSV